VYKSPFIVYTYIKLKWKTKFIKNKILYSKWISKLIEPFRGFE